MTRFRKLPKYRNRMTYFQVPNTNTGGTKEVPNPSSVNDVVRYEMLVKIVETKGLLITYSVAAVHFIAFISVMHSSSGQI